MRDRDLLRKSYNYVKEPVGSLSKYDCEKWERNAPFEEVFNRQWKPSIRRLLIDAFTRYHLKRDFIISILLISFLPDTAGEKRRVANVHGLLPKPAKLNILKWYNNKPKKNI